MAVFIADFETTTNKKNCRVWAWAAVELGRNDVKIGTNINDFFDFCSTPKENHRILFHKLEFDGQFLISWLLEYGFTHTTDPADRATRTFNTLISAEGLVYQIEVIFYKHGKNINKVTFWDSKKLIPLSVEKIADAFRLERKKLKIDYSAHNDTPPDTPLTPEEEEYIKNDVLIVAEAVNQFYSLGFDRMTIGSCAMQEYKKSMPYKTFTRLFPTLTQECFRDLKQAYRGGWCYVVPELANVEIAEGIVLDCNSIYPDAMRNKILPWGRPLFYRGQYKQDNSYPLFTQMIRCSFDIKPGKLPTVQQHFAYNNRASEYITSSNGEEMVLYLNCVDLDLFFEHYDVYNLEYIAGWKFRGAVGLFSKYIDKWTTIKIEAKKEGNWGLYNLAKFFLNCLYGKFGTNQKRRSKIPQLTKRGVVKYNNTSVNYGDGVYLPVASFITSYAREKTIRAAQKITDDYNTGVSNIRFVYGDTDSMHCEAPGQKTPEGIEIDQYKLGAWKVESKFKRAKYIRQKCYMEYSTEDLESLTPEYKKKITVAGMPEDCKKDVTFDNFQIGAKFHGRLRPHTVQGGVVLEEIGFTINA